jgi:RNA polymerase sigma factor (sigma-70 family)
MSEEPTTAAVQRLLDALAGDTPPEPIVRELLDRAVRRLQLLCAAQLHRSYPRLTQPPLNMQTDELLGGVVAGLIAAMRKVRPRTVREFFGLATQHMRWQLNDLARLLDGQAAVLALDDGGVPSPPSGGSTLTPNARRMLEAIDDLPEEEREAFNLIRVQGLTQPEAAEVLGVSVATVKRRLNRARLLLAEKLDDLRPGLPTPEPPPEDTPPP